MTKEKGNMYDPFIEKNNIEKNKLYKCAEKLLHTQNKNNN